jgi:hypothetical protein
MSARIIRLLAPVLAFSTACSPSIVITRDASLPIYPRSTYAWGLADGALTRFERDPRVANDSVRTRIEKAVDAELARRGFHRVAFADAQLVVHYHVGVRDRVDTIPALGFNCAVPPCPAMKYEWGYWGEPERAVREVEYTEGRLMLDFLARPSLRLAWRGMGQGDVKPNSASEAAIGRAVARLLKDFPGKP